MKKFISIFLAMLMVLSCFVALPISAETSTQPEATPTYAKTVYVEQGATTTEGTEDAPVGSLSAAFAIFEEEYGKTTSANLQIVFKGNYIYSADENLGNGTLHPDTVVTISGEGKANSYFVESCTPIVDTQKR